MEDLIDSALEGLYDVIFDVMELVLDSFVGRLLYYAETGLCKIVGMLDQMFQIFAGITKVSYDGNKDYLVNIFFNNRSINNVYWGMALIGIGMAFAFAIAAVVRKMFDISGRQQQSLGQIITSLVQTVFLILGMSAIMVIVLNSTNVLMQQVNYIFNDPENLDLAETIEYTDEEFAAMARALKTIGNYSLNPSHSSRYNINSCFNDIRQDLYYLQQQKVFRYYYTTTDSDGNSVNTWQSVLQKVANSHNLQTDLKLDVSYDTVSKSILEAMDVIQNDTSFRPLQSYSRVMPAGGTLPLDRYLFLMGTMHAAKNSDYNAKAELTDPVRGPYYSGEKSIYDISQVSSDFDIGFATDYLVVFLSGIAMIFDLVIIILNCIARIFNMLFLYLIAPPVFAARPFDNGGKARQWLTAFIVQSFSVFGTIIAMRLLMILLPIVTSSRLVLFENSILNAMAKLVLIFGIFEVSKKATSMFTGILAGNAGIQSVAAGDMTPAANTLVGGVTGAARTVAGVGLRATGKVADFATKPVQNVARRGLNATVGRAAQKWSTLGMGLEDKAEAQAKERLAVDQAYAKLTGGGGSYGGGGGSGGSAPGGGSLPGSGSASGGGGRSLADSSGGSGGHSGSGELPNNGGPGGGRSLAGHSGGSGGPVNSGGPVSSDGSGGVAKSPPPLPGKSSAVRTLADTGRSGIGAAGSQKPQNAQASSGPNANGNIPQKAAQNAGQKPLSPQAQNLSGTDANGNIPQKAPQSGGQKPLSPQAQKLFGTDVSGNIPQKAPQSAGQKPLSPQAQKLFGTDASGNIPQKAAQNAGQKPLSSQAQKPSGTNANGNIPQKAAQNAGQKPLSPQAQNLFGTDANGNIPQKAAQNAGQKPLSSQAQNLSGTGANGNIPQKAPQSGGQKPLSPQAQNLSGTGANGNIPQKAPQSGGQKPLSPQAQKLFGTDANGNIPQKAPQSGEQKPLSPQAQKLFGTDANGKAMPRETRAAVGSRSNAGAVPTRDNSGNGAPQQRNGAGVTRNSVTQQRPQGSSQQPPRQSIPAQPTQQNASASGQREQSAEPGQSLPRRAGEVAAAVSRKAADGEGEKQPSFAVPGEPPAMNQGGEGNDYGGDGGLPQNQSGFAFAGEGGYGSELTSGGNVELGDPGNRPAMEPAATPPPPRYMQDAPQMSSRPTLEDVETQQNIPSGLSAPEQPVGEQRPFDRTVSEPPAMNQGGEGNDYGGDGGLPQNQSGFAFTGEGGYGSELTNGGNVELGDPGNRPAMEPAATPPPPRYTRDAPQMSNHPTPDDDATMTRGNGDGEVPQSSVTPSNPQGNSSLPTRQNASAQPTMQSASAQPIRQSTTTQPTRQNTTAQPMRQNVPTQQARQNAPAQPTMQSAPAQPIGQSVPTQPVRQNIPAQPTAQRASGPARQDAPAQPTRQSAPPRAGYAPPRRSGDLPGNQSGRK